MPTLLLLCSCLERLISGAARLPVSCYQEHGRLILRFSHVPTRIFGVHVTVTIAIESGHDTQPDQLALRYKLLKIAGLPGFLFGWAANLAAKRFVKHPALRFDDGILRVHLKGMKIGHRKLAELIHLTSFHLPAGKAACQLSFDLED